MDTEILLAFGLQGLFYIVTLIFVLFTFFTAYHWFTYGSSKSASMLSLAVYLLVSAPLFITMAAALSVI